MGVPISANSLSQPFPDRSILGTVFSREKYYHISVE